MVELTGLLIQLGLTTLIVHAAWAEGWRTYTAARFGAIADVPASWSIAPPPTNNDGASFRSPNRDAEISIYGSFIMENDVSSEFNLLRKFIKEDGAVIKYTNFGPNWLVVSGLTKTNKIFYQKTITACNNSVVNTVYVMYPRSQKREYDFSCHAYISVIAQRYGK